MTVQSLLKIIQEFEKTSSFDVQSSRGRKRIDSTIVEEEVTAGKRRCEIAQCTGNCPNIGQVCEHDA